LVVVIQSEQLTQGVGNYELPPMLLLKQCHETVSKLTFVQGTLINTLGIKVDTVFLLCCFRTLKEGNPSLA